jgi:tRNA(Ile)-lysidine synthase
MASLKHKTATLDTDRFYQHLCSLTPQQQYLIAYSGGLDSHVLLHLLSRLQTQYPTLKLRSIYIDHGLQAVSTSWAAHCQHTATSLGILHQNISLDLHPAKGQSVEEIARNARYQVFATHLHAQETLLTAQHQDDQA